MEYQLKKMEEVHWSVVRAIYLEGIGTHQATFETTAPDWHEWNSKHLPVARIIATSDANAVIGWAALSRVSTRPVYSGVTEVSVYVATSARGKGVGRALLSRLIEESELNGIWTLQASIFPENLASLELHESLGFRRVGYRERIAKLNGTWRDTVLLERRSSLVGID